MKRLLFINKGGYSWPNQFNYARSILDFLRLNELVEVKIHQVNI